MTLFDLNSTKVCRLIKERIFFLFLSTELYIVRIVFDPEFY
jgi:hypothetical protein